MKRIKIIMCMMMIVNAFFINLRFVEAAEVTEIYETNQIAEDIEIVNEESNIELNSIDNNISWNVKNKNEKRTKQHYLKKGEKIRFKLRFSASKNVTVGVVAATNEKKYLKADNSYRKNITISKAGNYRIFVLNKSGNTIRVTGTYTLI